MNGIGVMPAYVTLILWLPLTSAFGNPFSNDGRDLQSGLQVADEDDDDDAPPLKPKRQGKGQAGIDANQRAMDEMVRMSARTRPCRAKEKICVTTCGDDKIDANYAGKRFNYQNCVAKCSVGNQECVNGKQ
jgi:hypothetical protein